MNPLGIAPWASQPALPVVDAKFKNWLHIFVGTALLQNLGRGGAGAAFTNGCGTVGAGVAGVGYKVGLGAPTQSGLQLNAAIDPPLSGVIVFERPITGVAQALFAALTSGAGGFFIKVDTANKVAIDKRAEINYLTGPTVGRGINVVSFRTSQTECAVSLNGGVVFSGVVTSGYAAPGAPMFGGDRDSSNEEYPHNQYLSAITSTLLTDAQLVSLSANPWQLFAPTRFNIGAFAAQEAAANAPIGYFDRELRLAAWF